MITNEFVAVTLLRMLFFPGLACLCFLVLLRFQRATTPNLRRVLWASVLLLGVCAFPYRFEVPLLEPSAVSETTLRHEIAEKPVSPTYRPHEKNRYVTGSQIETASSESASLVTETVSVPVTAAKTEIVASRLKSLKSVLLENRFAYVLLGIWASGVSLLLLRWVVRNLQLHYHLFRWKKGRTPAFPEAEKQYAELLARYRVDVRRLPILWSEDVGPALVRSIFGYGILLPRRLWSELPEEHRLGILRHELSHYLGRDTHWAGVLRFFAVLQWFNPLAWYALKKYEEATEWKCDDFAYAYHENGPKELVETLLSVHLSTESLGLYLSSFARINVLSRINRLLESENTKESSTMKKICYTFVLLAFFACGLFQPVLVAKPQKQETPSPENTAQKDETKPPFLTPDPEVWEAIKERREFREFVQKTQPDILKQLDLAHSMVELPDVTVERLESLGNDLWKSYREISFEKQEKYRELEIEIQKALLKINKKILTFYDPKDQEKIPLYPVREMRSAITTLGHLSDNLGEARSELVKLAVYCEQWGHPEMKFQANFTRNSLAGMSLWRLEKLERSDDPAKRPTFADFEKVRAAIVDFLATGTDVNSYLAADITALAGKMLDREAMTREQLMETYTMLLKSLEGEQHEEVRRMIEEQYRLLSLVGKPVVELSGALLDGTRLDWNSYKGKTVLIACSSWSHGSLEMEKVLELHELFSDKPLEFITCLMKGTGGESREADRTWVEKVETHFDYPGKIAVTLYAGDTKKLGELADLNQLGDHFGAHSYEYVGRTFMLIDSQGIVREIGTEKKMAIELEKLFDPPTPQQKERAEAVAKEFREFPKSCHANLYKIACAMHSYHDVHGCFPPAYTIDEQGRKLHSWRTILLPYLDQIALSKEIRMDEPWDSEHNKRFHETIIAVFQCHELEPSPMTTYSVVVGEQTMFPENGKTTTLRDNHDGTSNTIAILERATPGHWMEPSDITFEEALRDFGNNPKGVGFPHAGGCNCAFADASVRHFAKDLPVKTLRAVLTIQGGESITLPE